MGYREVVYDERHWRLLRDLREKALKLMKPLADHGLNPIVYGSLARGFISFKAFPLRSLSSLQCLSS